MREMHADIVLPAHSEQADVLGRARKRDAGDSAAFLAPDLLPGLVDKAEADFERELKAQEAGK
jgi:metallo-beta-lactamase class B